MNTLLMELAKPMEAPGKKQKTKQIQESVKYIHTHFQEEISVENLAKTVYMSASHFSKVFKEITSFSPYDYLLAIRLGRAKELLIKTEQTISEIACQTGFHSSSNFIYFFKKETGISPLKFRKMMF